jgi:hypothetical protein
VALGGVRGLSLANEQYFGMARDHRRTWIEDALAMAGRLDDPGLRIDARLVAQISLFSAATAEQRLSWLTAAGDQAEAAGDERRLVLATTLRAVVHSELGQLPQLRSTLARAQGLATRLRHQYALLILEAIEVPWLAMAGREQECDERLARMRRLVDLMGSGPEEHLLTNVSRALWRGSSLELVPAVSQAVADGIPISPLVAVCMLRGGEVDRARDFARQHPFDLDHDTWLSPLVWACAAEAALELDDPTTARRVYELLAPYAGRAATAGAHCAMGPVDAFLALAAAATGDTPRASLHADAALQLVEDWELPLVEEWLRGRRLAHGF